MPGRSSYSLDRCVNGMSFKSQVLLFLGIVILVSITFKRFFETARFASHMRADAASSSFVKPHADVPCHALISCFQMNSCAEAKAFLQRCSDFKPNGGPDAAICEKQLCSNEPQRSNQRLERPVRSPSDAP